MKFTQLAGERVVIGVEDQGSLRFLLPIGHGGEGQRHDINRAAGDQRNDAHGPADKSIRHDGRCVFAGAGGVCVDVSGEQKAHRQYDHQVFFVSLHLNLHRL